MIFTKYGGAEDETERGGNGVCDGAGQQDVQERNDKII